MLYKTLKNVEFHVKDINDRFQVEAYASTFGNIDAGRDIMEKSAFKKTLQEQKPRIKALFNHDWNTIIGKPLEIYEDSKGLYTKTQFVNTLKSNELYELVKEGIVNELSIGYDIVKKDFDRVQNVNHLREVKLYEYSFVTFAMNDQAQVQAVKAGRVLNSQNETTVRMLIESLMALLESNGTPLVDNQASIVENGCSSDDQQKFDLEKLYSELKKIKG
jgi:HK97 family phage prohead protease